jgi:cell division septal protein FtsQ
MTANRRRIPGMVGALCFVLAVAPAKGQQPPADAAFVIETIVVTGAKRYKNDQVVQVSGLAAGSSVRVVINIRK